MLMELLRTALDWYITTQWLSIPLTFAYLVVGYWFGVFNYWVAVESHDYPYMVRLLLFPLTAVCNEGWITISEGSSLSIKIVKANGVSLARLAWEKKDAGEGFYAVMFAPVWILKVFLNLLTLLTICALTVVYLLFALIVAAIFMAALAVKRYYLIAARACFNGARHAEGKKFV